ncbi:hypothetical protein ZOSMA_244G00110 [Zostera marina]|uniref:Uncharacterized protein n=1 Tax=Zostera marina TaxID=29655 RepID=A0A0K9PGS5_ZOSMR|nr:hypothetical protein ZOSMA_244G00110 [Zostera marina]
MQEEKHREKHREKQLEKLNAKLENREITTRKRLNQERVLHRPGVQFWGSHYQTLLIMKVMYA